MFDINFENKNKKLRKKIISFSKNNLMLFKNNYQKRQLKTMKAMAERYGFSQIKRL
jgi:hypothetical protein